MSLRIITGSTGVNHVTSQDDGSLNQAIFGSKSVVLDIGEKLSATIVDNNTVRLSDGDLLLQGRHARLDAGTSEDVTIGTGAIGMNRNDLIVARYTMDTATGHENIQFVVIEGTETSGSASDPAYNTGDIRTGSTIVDFPIYRVVIEGINITSATRLFDIVGGANTSLISDAYSSTTTYTVGQYCIYNNELWRCLIQCVGQTPIEGTYWTKTRVGKNLVTNNGEGKYGYLGADDSFIPFSSGLPIAFPTSGRLLEFGAFGNYSDFPTDHYNKLLTFTSDVKARVYFTMYLGNYISFGVTVKDKNGNVKATLLAFAQYRYVTKNYNDILEFEEGDYIETRARCDVIGKLTSTGFYIEKVD